MQTDKAQGPEDTFATWMLKELPIETVYEITKWFQRGLRGQFEAPSSWTILKRVLLRKSDASAAKGVRGYQENAFMSVVAKWCSSVVVHKLSDSTEPRLHVGAQLTSELGRSSPIGDWMYGAHFLHDSVLVERER